MRAGGVLARRDVLVGGGALMGGAVLWPARDAVSRSVPDTLRRDYSAARERVVARWWNPAIRAIRFTNGGAIASRNGLLDTNVAVPSFWQMECLENALFNDWRITGSRVARARIVDQWRFIRTGVPRFTPSVLAGNGKDLTINLSDDAAWQCWYLMHAHIATGDRTALAYLAEATVFTRRRFADPDVVGNPSIALGRSPNLAGIDYGTAPNNLPFATNRYGILYAVESEGLFHLFGKVSTSYEAVLALAELHVYRALGIAAYRDCAINSFRWIRERLRTPSPAVAAAATGQPVASRKAEGLYETELCLARQGGTPRDRGARFLTPVNAGWGKPIRSLDSTYINGAMAMALLSTRLAALPETSEADRAAYRAEAIHIANTLPRLDAYGRRIEGKLLIANTRDPWSDAHVAVPFAEEVLALPGVDPAVPRAFADTARHILATGITADGRLTADWSGPERNFTTGRSTWEADFAAGPGQQAGARQIMTEGETLAMVQAGVVAAGLA